MCILTSIRQCLHCINNYFLCAAPKPDDYLDLTAVASMVIDMSMNLTLVRYGMSNITVTGRASQDVYEAIAEGVLYWKNSSFQPLSLDATVCFTLFDDVYDAMECTEVIIVNVNDPPVISVSAALVQYDESSRQPVPTFSGLTIHDPDATPSDIVLALVEIDPVVDSNDALAIAHNTFGASLLNITEEGKSISIRGQANSSVYEAVLATVTFVNLDPEPDLSNRTLTLVVYDGMNSSLPAIVTVSILPFDDPPVCFFGSSEVGALVTYSYNLPPYVLVCTV